MKQTLPGYKEHVRHCVQLPVVPVLHRDGTLKWSYLQIQRYAWSDANCGTRVPY